MAGVSIPALVSPRLLRWARETAGFDLGGAARRVKRSEEQLRAWESGVSRPTVAQLRQAARVYRRPLAAFYLPHPPPDLPLPRDLRRLPAGRPRGFSPELRFLIRSARERQRWLREILPELGEPRVTFVGSATLDSGEEALARAARRLLKIPEDYRTGARHRALRDWIDAIESTGVFVFQASTVEVSEMRGLALPDEVAPIVVLNAKDAHVARTFTALHEFAHVLLGAEGVSNPDIAREPRYEADHLEAFCNAAAAEVLVPASWVRAALASEPVGPKIDDLIERMAESFRVSREVVARRLRDLGRMSTAAYEERRRRYQQEFEAREAQEESFPFPPARRSLRDNGRAFARAVLQAYTRELVTATQLSQLLNVRLKHLSKIERAVLPISGTGSAP